MNRCSCFIIGGVAACALAVLAQGAEPAVATPADPAGAKDRQLKLSAELRELSLKLRPAYERLKDDAELKAAMDKLMKEQMAIHALREAKLRADPETARMLDRMDALRKEIKELVGTMPELGAQNRPPAGAPLQAMPPNVRPNPALPEVSPKAP